MVMDIMAVDDNGHVFTVIACSIDNTYRLDQFQAMAMSCHIYAQCPCHGHAKAMLVAKGMANPISHCHCHWPFPLLAIGVACHSLLAIDIDMGPGTKVDNMAIYHNKKVWIKKQRGVFILYIMLIVVYLYFIFLGRQSCTVYTIDEILFHVMLTLGQYLKLQLALTNGAWWRV